ncbi:MAG: 5'/3'-nucleotidase SurE [Bdellovibrionales bacterium GWB1_55_8]|nr:MAG: 5'/3'-nucleotidase SurE [Bdellovibrionales bacterium GWB1_55_8]
MRILLSNDDGIQAHGLKVLQREFQKLGEVYVVAPLEEQSATGHSLTIHKPLRILPMGDGFYGVSGSPADCVFLALREIMRKPPDIVISGINRGANLAQDVYYSGTVSAAREACIFGIPSLAVSLATDFKKLKSDVDYHYQGAARLAVRVVKAMLKKPLPKRTFLNLNVPDIPMNKIKGIELTRQGFRYYSGNILRRKDHRGRDYYWVGGSYEGFQNELGSDCYAVESGFAALTPMKLDSTDLQVLETLIEEGIEPRMKNGVLNLQRRRKALTKTGKGRTRP